jgi:F-type H+-transporting ATPase subunit a
LEIQHEHLVNFTEWGILSLNKAVVWMFVAAFVSCFLLLMAGRKQALIPGRLQSAIELIVSLIREKLVIDTMGPEGLPYFPLIASLFFFIFFCNIVGIFPLGHFGYTATSNINVTGTLTIMVFSIVLVTALVKKGVLGFLKSFAPPGVPWWLLPLIYPVEVISFFAKHFALAVRLFANMFAGHMVILVFASGTALLFWGKTLWMKPLAVFPFAGIILMLAFEIFVATVQAFIFSILTALYIGESLHEHH